MKIKEIEIIGFKSFVDKVNLPLVSGITALVGPNGCGKSNVVDAIRWAMGEQSAKHLRGKSMEDVIFNGSETRKALGMAEVSLVFANDNGNGPADYSSYAEIMVTRRLFRSGESEYYINKIPCRLRDITELFLDTGVGTRSYSIIEQGKVDSLINSKPLDRRVLLEEAAGVSKYKNRKKEALSKIESTRQNLLRVNDILGELSGQMLSLKRQAGRLKGYQRLKERIRENDLILGSRKYRGMKDGEVEIRKQLTAVKDEEMRLNAEMGRAESELEEKKIEQYEREQSLSALQIELFEITSQIQRCESTSEFNRKELAEIRQRNEGAVKELEAILLQEEGERREVEELERREGECQNLLNGEDVKIRAKEGAISLVKEEYRKSMEAIDIEKSALVELLTEIANCNNSSVHYQRNLEDLRRRREKTEREKQELTVRHEEVKTKIELLSEECELLRERKASLESRLIERTADCRHMEKTLEEKERALKAVQDRLEKGRIQLHSLEELERRYEGYSGGIRSLMSKSEVWCRNGNGHHQVLADCLRVEPKYEIALEAVLGERLQSIIVDEWEEVWRGIDYLKSKAAGRGTFVTLQCHRNGEGSGSENPPFPDCRPLVSLVEVEGELSKIVNYLLKDVWLVNDLTQAVDAPTNRGRLFVTIDGELLDPFGLTMGGNRESLDSGILKRKRRIRELERTIQGLEIECEQEEGAHRECNERWVEIRNDLDSLNRELQQETLSLLNGEKDLDLATEAAKENEQRLKLLLLESEEILSLIEETDAECLNVRNTKDEKELERGEKERRLSGLQISLKEIEEEIITVEDDLTRLRINQASLKEKRENCLSQLRSQQGHLADLVARSDSIREKVRNEEERSRGLEASLEKIQGELDELIGSEGRLREKVDREKEMTDQVVELLHRLEGDLRDFRKTFMEIQPRLNEMNLKLAEYQINLEHLKNDMKDRYHLELEDVWETFLRPEGEEDMNLVENLQRLRAKLERFGEVNLLAQQELEEIAKRHEFLSQQQVDLQETLESLKKVINRINSTIRERFLETFNFVNDKFKEIFPKLFKGGKAELILSDEGDILETGIEIYAQPPGKRLQNIDLLSGGEKSMTAVALLLALFMVKPAPFCLLDEVDSPLDDMNTLRFIEQLRDMAGESQFILITHNKKTMEAADTLYGITMEERGVTKVVSVKLN